MKILRGIIIILLILCAVLFISLEIIIKLNGREIVTERLQVVFDRDVSVGDVKYVFPSGIFFENLDIPAALGAKGAKFTLDFSATIEQRQLVFSEIILVDPSFVIEKQPDSRLTWGWIAVEKFRGGPPGPYAENATSQVQKISSIQPKKMAEEIQRPDQEIFKPEPKKTDEEIHLSIMKPFDRVSSIRTVVNNVKIINGQVRFSDLSSPGKTATMEFKDLYVTLKSFAAPLRSMKTQLDCAGVFSGKDFLFDESWFEISGWVNFFAKDMELELKIIDPNGIINVFSDLTSKNNNMLVAGKLSIKGSIKKDKFEQLQASSFGDFLLGAVQQAGMDINLNFSFNTQMDNFAINKVNVSGNFGIPEAGAAKKSSK